MSKKQPTPTPKPTPAGWGWTSNLGITETPLMESVLKPKKEKK